MCIYIKLYIYIFNNKDNLGQIISEGSNNKKYQYSNKKQECPKIRNLHSLLNCTVQYLKES